MSPDAFRAAYCGAFEPDPLLPQAVALWRNYYAACEAYDRTVCTGPMGRDGILPATPHELALIGRHAIARRSVAMQAAAEAGIPEDVMRRAREIALRER